MKVALMSSGGSPTIQYLFDRHLTDLAQSGVEISALILDSNATKKTNPMKHAWLVARRQAAVAGCSPLAIFVRRSLWALLSIGKNAKDSTPAINPPSPVETFRVPSLNSDETVDIVKRHGISVACLVGTRIITKSTLDNLKCLVLNIHASDPRFVRGGPPVFWEVVDRRDEIKLTIHEAVSRLDAGPIYNQAAHPIQFRSGIVPTTSATMLASRPKTAKLFADTLLQIHTKTASPVSFEPGPVRSTPPIADMWAAETICRKKARARASSAENYRLAENE